MRVAYIQIHITSVQATSASTGDRNSALVGMSVSPWCFLAAEPSRLRALR
jgi:hypothetical protein